AEAEGLRAAQSLACTDAEQLAERLSRRSARRGVGPHFQTIAGIGISRCNLQLTVRVERECRLSGESAVQRRDHVADRAARDSNRGFADTLTLRPFEQQ